LLDVVLVHLSAPQHLDAAHHDNRTTLHNSRIL
jgi:hypothetical protein